MSRGIAAVIYLTIAAVTFTLGGLWHHRTIQGNGTSCPTHTLLGGRDAVMRSLIR